MKTLRSEIITNKWGATIEIRLTEDKIYGEKIYWVDEIIDGGLPMGKRWKQLKRANSHFDEKVAMRIKDR